MKSDRLEPECKSIVHCILPAIRASIAQQMSEAHGWNQARIAERLGVVQVAVSKYLNKKYSKRVESARRYIAKNQLTSKLVDEMVRGADAKKISHDIDRLCEQVVHNI